MVSCSRDNCGIRGVADRGRIGLVVSGNDVTKCGVSDRLPEEMLFSMPVVADNGDTLRLTAFLSDMDDIPSKGTPITSGNIGLASGYGTFNTSVYQGTDVYESVDDDDNHYPMALVTAAYDGTTDPSNPCWDLTGGRYYWPEDESRKLTFCSYAPVACNGVRTAVEWIVPASNEISTSFSYTLPEPAVTVPFNDAERQQDLLFAIDRNQTRSGRKRNGVSYAEVHFYHALTAVRFTRGAELNDCVIKDVTLQNFYGSGDCTFTRNLDGTQYRPEFAWTIPASSELTAYTQSFNSTLDADVARADDTDPSNPTQGDPLDPTVRDADPFNDGEYTFMMIPQLLDDNARIVISIEGRIHPVEFEIGSPDTGNPVNDARLKDWRSYAGKVITIRVESQSMDLVRVKAQDEVAANVKQNVVFRNTGRNPVYLRAAIVANWENADGRILAPYWVGDIRSDANFVLPSDWDTYWTYCSSDGYYYYNNILPRDCRTTVPLLVSFTAPSAAPSPDADRLDMQLVIQGVDARDYGNADGAREGVVNAQWPSAMVGALKTTESGMMAP